MIRTMIVDDQPEFLKRVREFLDKVEPLELVGEAVSGQKAIEKALELKPDLVLIDVKMADMDGLVATQRLIDELPDVSIIILSRYDLHEYREAAKIRGASAYVVKMKMSEDLLPAIQSVLIDRGIWPTT